MISTKNIFLAAAVLLIGFSAQARDTDESMLMLQEAMMDSNADYNKHKKKSNHEEFDRADDWSERNSQAIMIDGTKTYGNISKFKEPRKEELQQNREVSSHETAQEQEKLKD